MIKSGNCRLLIPTKQLCYRSRTSRRRPKSCQHMRLSCKLAATGQEPSPATAVLETLPPGAPVRMVEHAKAPETNLFLFALPILVSLHLLNGLRRSYACTHESLCLGKSQRLRSVQRIRPRGLQLRQPLDLLLYNATPDHTPRAHRVVLTLSLRLQSFELGWRSKHQRSFNRLFSATPARCLMQNKSKGRTTCLGAAAGCTAA